MTSLIQGSVELRGMVAQPPPPDRVIRPARCDDHPEARPVTEDSQMGELMDDDCLECFRRGQDEAP